MINGSSLRVRRAAENYPTIANRTACPETNENRPSIRVDTTNRLAALRARFGDISAYIVPSEDAHGSEYPPDYDKRRGYISGFSGSAGIAVITRTKAALWTDGRYFLQADEELDCNWIFMKQGISGVPSLTEWLISELQAGQKVGSDAAFVMNDFWTSYKEALDKENISLVDTRDDLVGNVWTTGRPPQPNNTINAYPVKYSGKSWQEKVEDVRKEMRTKEVSAVVVTDLAEVAWLVAARSSDINYNPFFVAFALLELDRVRLYIHDKNWKLTATPTDSETTQTLAEHLNCNSQGSCADPATCVEVKSYEDIYADVQTLQMLPNKTWISFSCNYKIFNSIPEGKRYQANTPIALMKAKKNEVERKGMMDCHVRDSAAIMIYVSKIEKEVRDGKFWDEITGADELERIRRTQLHNRGISFASISAVGSNGAIIHYKPRDETKKQITDTEIYLLDSGGQYVDGSTDITRTFHFGEPTAKEKEMYTRVLMGSIDLAMLKWPKGLYGRQIDAIARKPLWDVGLEYRHGTGHGMGHYLSIHEGPAFISKSSGDGKSAAPLDKYMFQSIGPGRISLTKNPKKYDEPLDEYMFFSDEPGYYEPEKFGIRLETIVMVDKVHTKYEPRDEEFLGFVPVALVPFEKHLIDYSLLRPDQVQWINNYHKACLEKVGPLLREQNQMEALRWLEARTHLIVPKGEPSAAAIIQISSILLALAVILHLV